MNNPKKSNRFTIIALMVLFASPVLLAVLMHSQWWSYAPDATRNNGELLQPALAVAEWPDTSNKLAADDVESIWTLVLATHNDCSQTCLEQLAWLRQVRAAQGRHLNQVNIRLATASEPNPGTRAAVNEISSEIQILAPNLNRSFWNVLATDKSQLDTTSTFNTYLLDPAGFIILRYPENSDSGGIRKDLGRLLTWSNKSRNGK